TPGSVRGASGNRRPYRDDKMLFPLLLRLLKKMFGENLQASLSVISKYQSTKKISRGMNLLNCWQRAIKGFTLGILTLSVSFLR
ncbi:hypothetical protein ACFL0Q_07600, partial [Thermodesulfobacteriota bacterium]